MTRIPESTVPNDTVRSLIGRAKSEIQAQSNSTVSDWYGNPDAERALFWLTAIFVVGEVGGGDEFSIGEFEFSPADDGGDELSEWRQRYESAVAAMSGGSTRPMGVESVTRSDRVYGE